ncbi:glycosyltransferase [Paenibacillus arenilitoris]|uniref:Glycosyltransferase n=1 Tax=Paenibacillus arenilitoris TaxID=2772299 RepID=A0A927H4X8_9BACL|nr:glycosyltransferase [Paenibacillus arenilitoris]MBD2867963.1 glycosyltransferase [Paenibacillus arenilitoris]
MKVAMIVSDNPQCGITTHANYVTSEFGENCEVDIIKTKLSVIRSRGILEQSKYYKTIALELNTRYDIVHIQHEYGLWGRKIFYYHFNLYNFLKNLTLPVVISLHSIVPDLISPDYVLHEKSGGLIRRNPLFKYSKYWAYIKMLNYISNRVNRFIIHSDDSYTIYKSSNGNGNIKILPLGIPGVRKISLADKLEAKARKGFLGKKLLVLFGFVSSYKGHETAIHALSNLPPEYILIIAGGSHPLNPDSNEYMKRLLRLAHRYNIRDRVIITGFLSEEEIDEWQIAADLVLAPYLEVGLSASAAISRAFAMSNAVVASDISAFLGIAEQTKAIKIFPSTEALLLVDSILEIEKNKVLLNRMREASYEYAEKNSMYTIANEHIKLYNTILSEN